MLSAYRVLDLTDERGLLCGQILADLGADVVAVEPPGGSSARRIGPFAGDTPNPERSLFWWACSRNKRGITLDVETEAGRERLLDLVRGADFLIESFAPGYLDGLGIGYAAFSAINPLLVMVSITPFGQSGPKANWAAADLTVWASSGTLVLTGDEDRPPARVPGEQAWLHAGAEAAAGALIAHHARERDGVGQHVDVSAQTAAMMATQSMILQAGWGENPLTRVAGGVKAGPLRLRFIYACSDGHVSITFLFGNALGPPARRLMEWMCEEGFVDAATRDKDWIGYTSLLLSGQEPLSELARCIAAIERFTRSHTKAELFAGAMTRGLLIVPVSTTADVVHSEQLAARDYWTPLMHPVLGRTVSYPGPIAKLAATPIRYRRPAPQIGEHNEEVSSEWSRQSQGGAARTRSVIPGSDAQRHPTSVSSGGGTTPASVTPQQSTEPAPTATDHSLLTTHSPSREATTAGDQRMPLEGVKVLELAWVMAGPMSSRYLADYGATVVHIESTTRVDAIRTVQPFKDAQPGPERAGGYSNINAGKLGLSLNLALPKARAVVLKLAAWADIVTESFSPKAMRTWGLDYDALRAVNPGLIMLSSCLNGQSGPWAGLAGYGTMGAQLAGFGALTGWPDRDPAAPFGAYTDYVVPKLTAATLLAALDHRQRTGEGQYIDFSQAEAAIHFLGPAMLDYTVNGRVQNRAGNASAEQAPHGVFPTQTEDRWVAIACATDAQWRAVCGATGHEDWASDPRFLTLSERHEHRVEMEGALTAWTQERDVDAIERLLQASGVPVHRVSTSDDAFADPQLIHRGHFVTVQHPDLGPVPVETSRMRFSRTPDRVATSGPTYGQHNDEVLRGILGLSDDEIVELVSSGALE